LLAKQVVRELGARVRYVDENFGASPLAERFGIRHYPAVFVDDVLVARPQDFYGWGSEAPGRYTPWKDAASRERFRSDLRRWVAHRLAGEALEGVAPSDAAPPGPTRLPELELTDVLGGTVDPARLRGRAVVVELWATWCPPCLDTIDWLDRFQREHPDDVVVLGLAVASEADDVRAAAERLAYPVVLADDALVARFGDLLAIPTLYLFAPDGSTAGSFYGAPPDLHERLERALGRVLGAGAEPYAPDLLE